MLNWKHVIALFAALALPASAHAYEAWRGPTGLLKHTEEKSFDGLYRAGAAGQYQDLSH